MKLKCPSCGTLSELQLPILLTVCVCGSLVKGKFATTDSPGEAAPQVAHVDYYEVLGLVRSATDADIKAAHRRRVKETHPDIGGDAEEFKLVQAAYEVLGDPVTRRRFDVGGLRGSPKPAGLVTPDFIGKPVTVAVRFATDTGLMARVAIVEVSDNSQLRGRVVGQMPYPGVESSVGLVGLLVAVPRASTLWQRFRAVATELASGFWIGLRSSTVGGASRQAELGTGTSFHNAGSVAGEVVGAVAVGAVGLAVGALTIIGRIYIAFMLLFLLVISLVLLVASPPIGLIFGVFSVWLTYKAIQKLRKKG